MFKVLPIILTSKNRFLLKYIFICSLNIGKVAEYVSWNFEQIDAHLILNIFGDNGDNFPAKRTILIIFSYELKGNYKVRKSYSSD